MDPALPSADPALSTLPARPLLDTRAPTPGAARALWGPARPRRPAPLSGARAQARLPPLPPARPGRPARLSQLPECPRLWSRGTRSPGLVRGDHRTGGAEHVGARELRGPRRRGAAGGLRAVPPLPGTLLGQGRQGALALEQPTMDWNLRSRSHFANLPVLLGTISGQGGSVVRSHRGRAQGSPRGSWRPGSPRGAGDTRRRKRKSKGWVCGVRLCNLAAPRGRGGRVPAGCRAEDPCVGPGATPCPALLDPKAEPRQLGFQRRSSAAPSRRGQELHPEP